MKKFLAAVTALILALSLVTIPLIAESAPEPQEGDVIFDVRNPESTDGKYYAKPGETVEVSLKLTGEYQAHAGTIQLDYDPEVLTVDHAENGSVLTSLPVGAMAMPDYGTATPGKIVLGIVCPMDPITAEGVVFTVYFKIAEEADAGAESPLELNVDKFSFSPIGGEKKDIPHFEYDSAVVVGEESAAPVLPAEIAVEDVTVEVGATAEISYTVLPEDAENKNVTFAIENTEIAAVDDNGVVTGVKAGETTLTVTSAANPEVKADAKVTVTEKQSEPTPPVSDEVVFDLGEVREANVGDKVDVELKLTGKFDASGVNVWLNYDPEKLAIEKVENGDVIAAAEAVEGVATVDYETVPGSLRLMILCPNEPLTANGTIVKVTFRVAAGLTEKTEIPLELAVNEFYNMPDGGEKTPIPFTANGSSIVVTPPVLPAEIKADDSVSVGVGKTVQIVYTVLPEDAADKSVTFAVADPAVAAVDEKGVVTGVAAGETTLTITSAANPAVTKTVTITVKASLPQTGFIGLVGLGVSAILAGAGVVLFGKKR